MVYVLLITPMKLKTITNRITVFIKSRVLGYMPSKSTSLREESDKRDAISTLKLPNTLLQTSHPDPLWALCLCDLLVRDLIATILMSTILLHQALLRNIVTLEVI